MHQSAETLILRDLACLLFVPTCFLILCLWLTLETLKAALQEQRVYARRWYWRYRQAAQKLDEESGLRDE